MSNNSEEVERDTEETANALVWPGPIEEGMVVAGGLREIQEHEDRRRNSRTGLKRPPSTLGQTSYWIVAICAILVSIAVFIWLIWVFIQILTLPPP